MRKRFRFAVLVILIAVLATWTAFAATTTQSPPPAKTTPGIEAARTISLITGVAISPLLGVGAVGAYEWWHAPLEKRAKLPWFAQPWFWVSALLLVAFVGIKDLLGTTTPTVLKKPFDVAETIENKISGLIAAGAFVPLIISIFPQAVGSESQNWLSGTEFATINGAALGNALMLPFALAVFAIVWLASHAINILILMSPFTVVDTALKAFRLGVLSLVTATSFANPYLGAGFCVVIIVISYFVAGWSFRLTVFGTVYVWDFISMRRCRFQPGAESNWMFTGRRSKEAPVRSYGKLIRTREGGLVFEYRPWLFLRTRRIGLPEGEFVIGRGLFYPEIDQIIEQKQVAVFVLPPRYRTHEEALARVYGFSGVRDIGLRRGLKAIWNWCRGFFVGTRPVGLISPTPGALTP